VRRTALANPEADSRNALVVSEYGFGAHPAHRATRSLWNANAQLCIEGFTRFRILQRGSHQRECAPNGLCCAPHSTNASCAPGPSCGLNRMSNTNHGCSWFECPKGFSSARILHKSTVGWWKESYATSWWGILRAHPAHRATDRLSNQKCAGHFARSDARVSHRMGLLVIGATEQRQNYQYRRA
jgi:hypothetical protein